MKFLLIISVLTWGIFYGVPAMTADTSARSGKPRYKSLSPGSARTGSFYIGLDYNPIFSEVKDFKFEGDGNTTRGIFPLKGDAGNDFRSHDFDWDE